MQAPGGLNVEQTAVYERKRVGNGKICNGTRFESSR